MKILLVNTHVEALANRLNGAGPSNNAASAVAG